jgi:hypothetical protein
MSFTTSFHIRQAKIPPGVAVRQLLVVEAEDVEDGGVQVVDVDFVFGGVVAVVVGWCRGPLVPLPASHMVNPSGLWSRPFSFHHGRVAEFASPPDERVVDVGDLEVGEQPGGRSTSRAFFSWPAFRSACWSHCTLLSLCVTWMNRTPASANRRAIRHIRPKLALMGCRERRAGALPQIAGEVFDLRHFGLHPEAAQRS